MNAQASFERCQAFINCQAQSERRGEKSVPELRRWRAVTFSRETGAGAHSVAELLATQLQKQGGCDAKPWMVFDRNLVEKVLEEHNLPASVGAFMGEERVSEINDTVEEFFGLHPPSWILIRKTAETILHLAELGNTILIGRGASVITNKLPDVFHVRLVAALEQRVATIQHLRRLKPNEARAVIRKEDRGRRAYLEKYFARNIDDPLLYHLVINTSLVHPEHAAAIIGNAMLNTLPGDGGKPVLG
jgi:hypothetical protein